jgi:predicted  nucleic acid-binding Zn-ribbon protein
MATVDPKATLAALLGLQKIDAEIWRIEQRIKEMPALLERRSERLRQSEARVAAALARIQELKKQVGLHELEVKGKEAEILKIQGAQGQSRTNEEFRAFGDHVARLRKDAREIEDRILDCMTKVEAIEKELVDLKATRDALKRESDADAEQWRKDETAYRAELALHQAARAAKAKEVPPGPLSVYERVLRVREGKAMVPADSRICGGCSMSITANDFTRLHRGNELVSCRSCERILYLAESTAATW